jgi:hypothetical protein
MTESFAQLFEQSIANQRIRSGMILTGLVVEVGEDMVIVNVGLKSEANIPLEQFKNERGEVEVKAGDSIEVALDAMEDGTGETRLSRDKAKRARTWTRLEESFNKSEIVTGTITAAGVAWSGSWECCCWVCRPDGELEIQWLVEWHWKNQFLTTILQPLCPTNINLPRNALRLTSPVPLSMLSVATPVSFVRDEPT